MSSFLSNVETDVKGAVGSSIGDAVVKGAAIAAKYSFWDGFSGQFSMYQGAVSGLSFLAIETFLGPMVDELELKLGINLNDVAKKYGIDAAGNLGASLLSTMYIQYMEITPNANRGVVGFATDLATHFVVMSGVDVVMMNI